MNQTQKYWICLNDESKKQILEYSTYDEFLKNHLIEDEEITNLPKSDYAKIQKAINQWLKNRV